MKTPKQLLLVCGLSVVFGIPPLMADDAVGTTFESGGLTYKVTAISPEKECQITKITTAAVINDVLTIPAKVNNGEADYDVVSIARGSCSALTNQFAWDTMVIEDSPKTLRCEDVNAFSYTDKYGRTLYMMYKNVTIGRTLDGPFFSKNSYLYGVITITKSDVKLAFPSLHSSASSILKTDGKLIVPKNLYDQYKEDPNWGTIATVIAKADPYGENWEFSVDHINYRILTTGDTDGVDGTCEVIPSPEITDIYSLNIPLQLPQPVVINGHKYKLVRIGDDAFNGCKLYVGYASPVIPDGVVEIGDNAFRNSKGTYLDMKLPESVKKIGEYAFSASFVRTLDMPGVTELGKRVFDGCKYLETCVLPEGLTGIPDYAFYDASGLKSLTIPTTAPKMGYMAIDAFKYSDETKQVMNIEEFIWNDTSEPFGILSNEFYYCKAIKRIVLGRPMRYTTGGTYNLFSSKNSIVNNLGEPLEELVIGDKVEQILINDTQYDGKFDATIFPKLSKLTIGKALRSVPDFSSNHELMEITCTSTEPQTVDGEFSDETYANAVLNIPEGSREAYAKAPIWRKFRCLMDIDIEVEVDKIKTFVGEGENVLPVMVRWADNSKINNVVWGVRYSGSEPTAEQAVALIKAGDSRFSAANTGISGLGLDIDADETISAADQQSVGTASEWSTLSLGNLLLIYSGDLTENPAYVFYIPELNKTEAEVSIPQNATVKMSDDGFLLPFMISGGEDLLENYICEWTLTTDEATEEIVSVETSGEGFKPAMVSFFGQTGSCSVKLTLTVGGKTYETTACELSVEAPEIPVENVSLDVTSVTETPDGALRLTATTTPEDATFTAIRWTSDNEATAVVDNDGNVTIKGGGKAVVTAAYAYQPEGAEPVSATCTIDLPKATHTLSVDLADRVIKSEKTGLSFQSTADTPEFDFIITDAEDNQLTDEDFEVTKEGEDIFLTIHKVGVFTVKAIIQESATHEEASAETEVTVAHDITKVVLKNNGTVIENTGNTVAIVRNTTIEFEGVPEGAVVKVKFEAASAAFRTRAEANSEFAELPGKSYAPQEAGKLQYLVHENGVDSDIRTLNFDLSTGVEEIAIDALGNVEIFNLQGVRMNKANLSSGIYIVVSEGVSKKVYLK